MSRVALALIVLGARYMAAADTVHPREAPNYTAASIVNAADNLSGVLAPNAIGTIYGVNLSFDTAGLTPGDVQGGVLPITLGASETQVFVGNIPADLYYVSPTQINFLVPPNKLPVATTIRVTVDGRVGPEIPLMLLPAAPGLFQLDAKNAVATLVSGAVLTPSAPAHPGDIVVLYATGLGATVPPAIYGELSMAAASLAPGANLKILLNGAAVDDGAITYAGSAPGFAGLYQINLALPKKVSTNPEIKLVMGKASSIAGVHLPVGP
jgi:uncharacterized protein (TIGR03437 family)